MGSGESQRLTLGNMGSTSTRPRPSWMTCSQRHFPTRIIRVARRVSWQSACPAASASWWSCILKKARLFGSLAQGRRHATNEDSIKKNNSAKPTSDMRPEFDFASMKGGVRGKYAARYRSGTNLVLLDPEISRAFPTAAAVHQVLRAVLNLASEVRLQKVGTQPARPTPTRRAEPKAPG